MTKVRFEEGMKVRCINFHCCGGMATDEESIVVKTDSKFLHIQVADNIPGRSPWYQCKKCLVPVEVAP